MMRRRHYLVAKTPLSSPLLSPRCFLLLFFVICGGAVTCRTTLLLTAAFALSPISGGSNQSVRRCNSRTRQLVSSSLWSHAEPSESATPLSSQKSKAVLGRKQGVYVRPSAAIERGSGFFIPGLEGYKVKLLFGSILMLLTVLNYNLSTNTSLNSLLSEGLATLYALLVLFQGAVEFFKAQTTTISSIVEQSSASTSTANLSSSSTNTYEQQWLVRGIDDAEWKERVAWAASTYIVLTPATHMILASRQGVVFAMEPKRIRADVDSMADNTGAFMFGCAAALDTLASSTSGRVALPLQHPTVVNLGLATAALDSANAKNEGSSSDDGRVSVWQSRTVVLQRVNDDLCWIMASPQLLPAFTQQDLQWLGQLAASIQV